MLGIFRFILAYLVLLSHFPENGFKLNLGISSVVIFYFISGSLMLKSYLRFKKFSTTPVRSFYLDRVIKIFPQYLAILLLTAVCFTYFGRSTQNTFHGVSFEASRVFFDALLLPVNLAVGSVGNFLPILGDRPIVPPAWSLSLEFHFYLLLPLLVGLRTRFTVAIALISSVLLMLSFFSVNPYLNTLNFGYRYILPMLVVFIFGMLYSSKNEFDKKIVFIIWGGFCIVLLGVLPGFSAFYNFAVQEIMIGAVLALPLFHYVINFKIESKWFNRIDRFLGELSYPVFLSHFLAMYLAQHLFGVSLFAKIYFLVATVAITLFISIILALIQRRIDSSRIDIRGFSSMRKTH